MDAARTLTPSDGHLSIARVTRGWYIACGSRELGTQPLARKILGIPLVLFRREDGLVGALLDRCAHRNVPLSLGRVAGERLQCSYHGWEFDIEGHCGRVPGLCSDPGWKKRLVPSFPVVERDGYVWVYATPDVTPEHEPYALPFLDERGYTTVRRQVEVGGTLHAAVENALDVPHTAFVHRGLFRGSGKTNRIKAVLTREADRVVAEYIGEPRPEGLAARILSPSGGTVTHFDRFIMPSIAQVDYRIGTENHIIITSACTPVDDFLTRMHATVSFRMRFPGWLIKLLLYPIAMKIFKQDKVILERQTETIKSFGGESYTSTEIDLMGPQIWRLLRRAELGKSEDEGDAEWRREVELET